MATITSEGADTKRGFGAILHDAVAAPFDGEMMDDWVELIPKRGGIGEAHLLGMGGESAVYC